MCFLVQLCCVCGALSSQITQRFRGEARPFSRLFENLACFSAVTESSATAMTISQCRCLNIRRRPRDSASCSLYRRLSKSSLASTAFVGTLSSLKNPEQVPLKRGLHSSAITRSYCMRVLCSRPRQSLGSELPLDIAVRLPRGNPVAAFVVTAVWMRLSCCYRLRYPRLLVTTRPIPLPLALAPWRRVGVIMFPLSTLI